MRAVVQRVSRARVVADGREVAAIGRGLVVFAGIAHDDDPTDIDYIASKVWTLRVFPDEAGRMNRSALDVGAAVLVVSQFTVMGDVRKGRRPAFDAAAPPERARPMFEALVERMRTEGPVQTGVFQAQMDVDLVNDGPVTILLDSERRF